MKSVKLFEYLDSIDDEYIASAKITQAPPAQAAFSFRSSGILSGIASVAAVLLVLGVIFVWSIVGKDMLKAQKGDDTTTETTTAPITTPDNVIVPPITDNSYETTTPQIYVPETTTVPITTPVTTPVTTPATTSTTTTVPITTTPPPVTTTTPITTTPSVRIDPQKINYDNLWEIAYDLDWPNKDPFGCVAHGIYDLEIYEMHSDLQSFVEDLPRGILLQNFADVSAIDLLTVLFGTQSQKLTYDEYIKLAEKGGFLDKEVFLEDFIGLDAYKLTTEDFNDILREYFHTTLTAEMKETFKNYYLAEYDAYYAVGGGYLCGFEIPKVEKAWMTENGDIVMTVSDNDNNGKAYGLAVITLKKDDGQWIIDQIMYVSAKIANKYTWPNANVSIFENSAEELLELMKEAGIPEEKLIKGDFKKLDDQDLMKVLDFMKENHMQALLMTDCFTDPYSIDVTPIMASLRMTYLVNDERLEIIKILYQLDTDFQGTFEEYINSRAEDMFYRCTTDQMNDIMLKFFGVPFTDEMKDRLGEAIYIDEYDNCYWSWDWDFMFFEVGGFKNDKGEILLSVPSYDEDMAKIIVLSPTDKGYVISQIATSEY